MNYKKINEKNNEKNNECYEIESIFFYNFYV